MWRGESMASAVARQVVTVETSLQSILLRFLGNAICAATAGGHVAVCLLFSAL